MEPFHLPQVYTSVVGIRFLPPPILFSRITFSCTKRAVFDVDLTEEGLDQKYQPNHTKDPPIKVPGTMVAAKTFQEGLSAVIPPTFIPKKPFRLVSFL